MKESTVEQYLKRHAEAAGGMAIKIPATYCIGIPDRLVLLPGGRMLFAELKSPGKKPRKIQAYMHDKIRGLGFRVEVIDSREDVRRVIREVTA